MEQDNKFVKSLIQNTQRGNHTAFEQLYQIYGGKAYAVCLRLTADTALAEDLTIKAFSTAWENIGFVRDDTPFSGWITGITIHTFLNHLLTTEKKEVDKSKLTFPKNYLKGKLEESIYDLPARERHVVVLHVIEKYSLAETSDFLGITYKETEDILNDVKNTLLNMMDHVYGEEQLMERIESFPDRIPPAPSVWMEIDAKIMNEKIVIAEKKEEEKAKEIASAEAEPEGDITNNRKTEKVKKELPQINFGSLFKNKSFNKVLRYLILLAAVAVIYYYFLYDKTNWTVSSFSGTVTIGGRLVNEGTILAEEDIIKGTGNSYYSLDISVIGKIQSSGLSEIKCISDSQLTFTLGNFKIEKSESKFGFTADIPSAIIKDLTPGGGYDLQVNPGNNSVIENKEGWIIVSSNLVKYYVPRGYTCEVKATGPIIPYHKNSAPQFKDLLNEMSADADNRDNIATLVIQLAQQSDFLSLWNMLRLVSPMIRGQIFDAFAKSIQLPATISREGIIFLDEKKVEALRLLLEPVI